MECEFHFWTPDEDEYSHQSQTTRSSGVQLATVKLTFNVRRQNMPTMNLGILRVLSQYLSNQDVKDLIEWIIRSRVALVTGYFGTDSPQLRKVAKATRATWSEPAARRLSPRSFPIGSWFGVAEWISMVSIDFHGF